jgi:hypothetical protein
MCAYEALANRKKCLCKYSLLLLIDATCYLRMSYCYSMQRILYDLNVYLIINYFKNKISTVLLSSSKFIY